MAGRARNCTRLSSTPETSSKLRNRRFVSGFSKASCGCTYDLAGVLSKSFQVIASNHA